MHNASPTGADATRARGWFSMPRVRPDQSLFMPTFVTLLVLGYLSCGVYWFDRPRGAAPGGAQWWEAETAVHGWQRMICIAETLIVLYCLWGCVLADPGRVPNGWVPASDVFPPDVILHSEYCRKCDAHKMPRTRHCQYCRRCVARYDHHCDWVDNCIGYRNHKYFILFLWYVTVMIIHYFYMLVCMIWSNSGRRKPVTGSDTFYLAAYVTSIMIYSMLAFGLLLFAGTFCFTTTRNLVCNETTVEAEVPAKSLSSVFHKGVYGNIKEVMGDNPLLWFVPTSKPLVQPEFDKEVQLAMTGNQMV